MERKTTVTYEEREAAIQRILAFILKEFDNTEITVSFTRKLLEDTIRELDRRADYLPARLINRE